MWWKGSCSIIKRIIVYPLFYYYIIILLYYYLCMGWWVDGAVKNGSGELAEMWTEII
jgi:hypothetical protein